MQLLKNNVLVNNDQLSFRCNLATCYLVPTRTIGNCIVYPLLVHYFAFSIRDGLTLVSSLSHSFAFFNGCSLASAVACINFLSHLMGVDYILAPWLLFWFLLLALQACCLSLLCSFVQLIWVLIAIFLQWCVCCQ